MKKSSFKWPVCTLLTLAILGGTIYWGYDRFRAEQALTKAAVNAAAQRAGEAASGAAIAYRAAFSASFLAGFALVMAAILGSVIYFWWSLKDLEGGRRYGEEEKAPPPDEASAP